MKRFTETDKWRDPWFRKLPGRIKVAYLYLLDCVDNAGVWDPDFELANFQISFDVKWDEVQKAMGDRLKVLENGKWHLTRFISFQYGELNEDCKPHQQVIRLLATHGIKRVSKGYTRGTSTPKDKDKDKDKDSEPAVTADQVYDAYPRKEARPKAIEAIKKAAAKLDASGPIDGHENGMSFLLDRARTYAECVARWSPEDRAQYAPHPTTWFNQERYLDDPKNWTRGKSAPTPPREPLGTFVEPIGWQKFVGEAFPDCAYAPGQPKHGCKWEQVERDHQVWISKAMVENAGGNPIAVK